MKKNSGITLIALVITIIVLIILAGISINLLLGQNGLLQKAKDSKEVYDTAQMKEEILLMLADYNIEKQTTGITLEEFLTKKNVEFETDGQNVRIQKDSFEIAVNKATLQMEEPVKSTRSASISLNKSTVEPDDSFTATLTLGEDVDITKCKYAFQKTTETPNVTNQVTSTTINVTAPNEKGDYYFYLLVGYKDNSDTVLKKVNVKVNVEVTGVTLNKASTSLFADETDNLTATVTPTDKVSQAVTWNTSNSAIATVSPEGLVTAVTGGTVQITATSQEDPTKSASCNVTVDMLESIAVTTAPTNTEYNTGDNFDATGMVVTATYTSGTTKDVTGQVTITPTTFTAAGSTTVTVSYEEAGIAKTATTTVNVTYVPVAVLPTEAQASSTGSSDWGVAKTYDSNDTGTFWRSTYPVTSSYLIYTFSSPLKFDNIQIKYKDYNESSSTQLIKIYGSNTKDSGYTEIAESQSINKTWNPNYGYTVPIPLTFDITDTNAYQYIKVTFEQTSGGSNLHGISDIKFMM